MMQQRWLGHIVRLRPAMVSFLSEWPNIGTLLSTLRALAWLWAGWPIVGTIIACGYAYVVGTHWKLSLFIYGASIAIDLIPNSLAGLLPGKWQALSVWAPRLFTVGLAGWAAWNLGLGVLLAGFFGLVGLLVIERIVATNWCGYDLWRLWCQFRRRVPITWTIMAGKTEQIQGAGQGGEVNLSKGFRNRPWLDHPAMNLIPAIDCTNYRVVGRAFSPPGRNMHRFNDVVDEMASDDPFIREIALPRHGKYDSWTTMVVDFHRPTDRPNLREEARDKVGRRG